MLVDDIKDNTFDLVRALNLVACGFSKYLQYQDTNYRLEMLPSGRVRLFRSGIMKFSDVPKTILLNNYTRSYWKLTNSLT